MESTEAQAESAMARVRESIARSCGQHSRAIREGFQRLRLQIQLAGRQRAPVDPWDYGAPHLREEP